MYVCMYATSSNLNLYNMRTCNLADTYVGCCWAIALVLLTHISSESLVPMLQLQLCSELIFWLMYGHISSNV